MKSLTTEQAYWLTIGGIFACGILMGFALAKLGMIWTSQDQEEQS